MNKKKNPLTIDSFYIYLNPGSDSKIFAVVDLKNYAFLTISS